MNRQTNAGFTLVELMVAAGAFGVMSVGLLAVLSTTTRLMARNLATNHSHETVRTSSQRMMSALHDAAAPFSLITFDGASYGTVVPAAGSDVDPLSRENLSQRSNGVAFRRFSGGPYPIIAAGTIPGASTALSFDFGVNGELSYSPQVGDKVVIPVIKQTLEITAIITAPNIVNTVGRVSFAPAKLGYAVEPTATNMMTAYFLRRVGFTVWKDQLRFHPNFTGAQRNTHTVVRDNITSPRPFSLLFSSPTEPIADSESLHVSIEAFDTGFSARRFLNGTTTYQTVVSPRTQPIFIPNID